MVPTKSDADALAFAGTIVDKTEAEIFMSFWSAGNTDAIKGHFPAFYGEAEPVKPELQHSDTIIGSALLPSYVTVNGKEVALGDVVMGAFNDSGLTANQWNMELSQDDREDAITQWIVRLENAEIPDTVNPFETTNPPTSIGE